MEELGMAMSASATISSLVVSVPACSLLIPSPVG
jgi:hypothetical protein